MQQTQINKYLEALKQNPQDYETYYNLGILYYNLKQYDQAEQNYKFAIQYKPDLYQAYYNLGIVYQNLKQYDQAEQNYKFAIQYKPDYYQAYYNLGNVYQNLKQYDQAEQNYKFAIQYKPDFSDAYYNLGNLYQDLKQYDQAEQNYKFTIQYKPDYYMAYSNLGVLYQDLKQYDQAEQNYKFAIQYKPDYYQAYYNLGKLYKDLKQYDQAEQNYKFAIQHGKNSQNLPIYQKNLGILYKENFLNYEKSKYCFEQIKHLEKYKIFANEQLEFLNEKINKEQNLLKDYFIDQDEFIQNYQQLEKIGQGQYGDVFKIKHIQSQKNYAMKVIPLSWDRDELLQEVNNILKIQIKFNSKSIVKVQFVVETKPNFGSSQLLIGMELSQGTLQNIKKPLTQKQAKNLIQLTLKGLQEMYYQGMIHRDIKPDNILYFEEDQSFKLADFGTSRFTQSNQNKTVSLLTLIGTPAYLGPELYNILKEKGLGGQQLDKEDTKSVDWYANDVYGLGMSFFFAICQVESVTPFRNRPDLIKQELEKMENQNKYDPIVYQIIEKMTSQNQKERANILFNLVELSEQLS